MRRLRPQGCVVALVWGLTLPASGSLRLRVAPWRPDPLSSTLRPLIARFRGLRGAAPIFRVLGRGGESARDLLSQRFVMTPHPYLVPLAQSLAPRFQHLVPAAKGESGSMGTLYKAWDSLFGVQVAIKVLRSVGQRDRFRREARVLATLQHEHIVRYVADGVTPSGDAWLAMEWLEGEDLDTRLERGPLSIYTTFVLALALVDAIGWAHACGFLHRDIKPSNVFLVHWDAARAKVIDFGLTRLLSQPDLTATGTTLGTLLYMPPEQAIDAKRADARADLYSLGAVLFHCLTGRPPVDGDNVGDILDSIFQVAPPPVRVWRPETPMALAVLVDAMLAKDPARRPPNAETVMRALGELTIDPEWDLMPTIPVMRETGC
jgi:eukaryotic-like serine/threonine-protein kinase